jgi:hypothetical protein
MTRTQFGLAPPDINGVGQENVGAGEVNLHLGLRGFRARSRVLRKQGPSMASASGVTDKKESADP